MTTPPAVPAIAYFRLFFFTGYGDHRDLHSFPTRRSSDLTIVIGLSIPIAIISTFALMYFTGETHQRSEEHTSELQSRFDLVCRLLLEKKKQTNRSTCGSFDQYARIRYLDSYSPWYISRLT